MSLSVCWMDDSLTAVGDAAEDVFVLPDEAVPGHLDEKRSVAFTSLDRRVRLDLFNAKRESTEFEDGFSAERFVMRHFSDNLPSLAAFNGASNQVDGDVGLADGQRDERRADKMEACCRANVASFVLAIGRWKFGARPLRHCWRR